MTHLRIEQTTGSIEEVNSSVITKLYEIAHAGLDVSSNLLGRLHSPIGIRSLIQWLTSTYPNLYINVDDYAIEFEDPKMVTYLNSIGVGSNGIVTEALAAAATVVANSANTEVTKFNEFKYFTNITSSRGGFESSSSGVMRFYGWTALEEIDISNLTSIGHYSGSAWEDTFVGCSSLKKVTASSNLSIIGHNAFFNCENLELLNGLSGNITIANNAFYNCRKLQNSTFLNCNFTVYYNYNEGENGRQVFMYCSLIQLLAFNTNTTIIGEEMCRQCSNLTTVTGLSNVNRVRRAYSFAECPLLSSIDINLSNLTISTINTSISDDGMGMFRDCSSLSTVQGTLNKVPAQFFKGCSSLSSFNLSNTDDIGYEAFKDCTSLQTVGSINNISALSNNCFENCRNVLEFVNLSLPSLTFINDSQQGCFRGCTQIQHVSDLGNLTAIGHIWGGEFDGCTNLLDVTLPATITTIRYQAIQNSKTLLPNLRWVKILSTSVPTYITTSGWGTSYGYGHGFGEEWVDWDTTKTYTGATYPIYVRDDLYSLYISTVPWDKISHRLKRLSEFATDFPND